MADKQVKDHDYSIVPVGEEGKRGFPSMLVIMLGFTFYTGTMLTGGQLGTSLTFRALVLVLLAGDLILGAYTALLSYISAKTSLSTHLLARYSFGKAGSYFVSGILGITQVGWFGVSVVMLAVPVSKTFPVIALPWNVPLVDVFEELGHAIAYHDQIDSGKEDLLSGIIFGNNMDPDVLRMQSEMIGYDINPPQKIFAVHFYKKGENAVSMTKAEKETAVKAIGDTMEKAGFPALISHYSNNVAGIFGSGEEGQKNVLKEAAGHLKEVLDGYHFYFGCGRECASLERLKESFQEASKCIVLGKKLSRDGQVLFWENLGFYHLLMAFDSKEPLDRYSHAVIGGLLQYDRENHTKLLETLEVYLEQNCSLKHTAEILYTHRNTVKYRITRIVEITGKSPDSAFERLELYNAVLIWRFCQ